MTSVFVAGALAQNDIAKASRLVRGSTTLALVQKLLRLYRQEGLAVRRRCGRKRATAQGRR